MVWHPVVAAGVAGALLLATHAGSTRAEAVRTRDAIASIGTIRAYATARVQEGKYLRGLIDAGILPAALRVAVTGGGALPYFTMWPMLDVYGHGEQAYLDPDCADEQPSVSSEGRA